MRKQHKKGFTIIEVVLVLTIAGLIFLMVFVALPSLQRGQRDLERKQVMTQISSQVTEYISSTRGTAPTSATALGVFVKGYLGGTSATVAGDSYRDPNGTNYTLKYATTPTEIGQIGFYSKSSCKTDGTDGIESTNASRDFAITVKLENQSALYCIDNNS